MANVVAVLLVELVVGHVFEASPPEDERFFDRQSEFLEEEIVLQSTIVFEVASGCKCTMQVLHAQRGVCLDKRIDHACGDGDTAIRRDAGARVVCRDTGEEAHAEVR